MNNLPAKKNQSDAFRNPVFRRYLTGLMVILAFLWIAPVPAVGSGWSDDLSVNAGEPSELDRARRQFEEGQVLQARMRHEFIDSYTGETQVTEGEIWISKERYMVRAEQQTILVDGDMSRVYNAAQNKLVISEYEPEEDDFAPSRFFSESEEMYIVTESYRENEINVFILQSDDPFEIFQEVIIRLDDELKPLDIEAVDQMDNRLKTEFTDAEYLAFSESLFQLEYPEDVEIIDLRK